MDSDILEDLYRKYYRSTVLYCLSLCGNEALAQDIASDAFVKAYLSLPNNVSSFPYWLMRVCKNLWIDYLRKHSHMTSDEPLQYLADQNTPENRYLQDERSRCLWKIISELPVLDREIIILHYFSGLSQLEISKVLRKSYPAIRQRMIRTRQLLKTKLEEQGYGYES